MSALAAQHIRKSFGPQVVLDDATFTLARGEKVGLIGANGTGKSTLAKILAGAETPDGGTISVRRGLTIRYLAQEPELDPEATARAVVEEALTAWTAATTGHAAVTERLAAGEHDDALVTEQAELDDAILRLGGWERGHEALGFLDKLGVRDVDRPCGGRSGGERRRIALAQLLVASPDIAIVDEPTNHLDADTAMWLEGHLANDFRGAIVLVTHDRYFLDAIVQRIVELERGRLSSYPGGYG
ncbi:MAG: ATP-binding cassette domain-containing protein, partial [Polyangiaceae bacterium]